MKVQERIADYAVLTQATELRPLGEVIKPTRPRVKPSEKPHLPFIGMEHVEAHTMRLLGTVPASTMKSSAVNFQPGDVLYGRLRPYLNKVYRPDFEGLCSAEFIVFPKTESLDSRYLQYFLNSAEFVSFATHLNAGDRPRVDFDQLAPYPFPVRPLDQQKRIVAEIEKQFSRLDEAVANLKRVKANLKRYKAAILKTAVAGKLTEAWRKQHPDTEPASEHHQRILAERRTKWEQAQLAKMQAKGKPPKDAAWKKKYPEPAAPDTTDLPELPAGWQWVSWETVLDFEEGAFKRGPFGSALTKAIFVESGYKVYEQYCPINDDPSFARYFVTEKKYKEMEGFAVKAGDFLISCSGVTLGRITQIPEDYEPGIINQALLRVRLNSSLIDDGYFVRLFRSPYFQKRIFDNSQGAAIPNVKGVKELKAIPIPLPPIDEQMALSSHIDEQMSIIANAVQQVDANVKRAERLRQSILSRAFSGSNRPIHNPVFSFPMNSNKD